MSFTAAELAEMARADAEIEASFQFTDEEMRRSIQLDQDAVLDKKDLRGRRITEAQRRYYEAHKEEIAEAQRRYYEAHKEEIAEGKANAPWGNGFTSGTMI